MSDKTDKTEMYDSIGIAAIILAMCLGVGSCSALARIGRHPDPALEARVSAIEARKCTLMAVTTPTGTATICPGADQ